MKYITGIGVSPGIAAGKVFLVEEKVETLRTSIESVDKEIGRLNEAIKKSSLDLNNLYQEAIRKIGPKEATIFEAHLLMLEDEEFTDRIKDEIHRDKINAEWAVENIRDYYVSMFLSMENDYMKERAQDIKDISWRIINYLKGRSTGKFNDLTEKRIVIAKEITPSDTAQMDPELVVGILTESGGKTSHAAIISRALGIPAIVGIDSLMNQINDEDYIVFDGDNGSIYINPTETIAKEYDEKKKKYLAQINQLFRLKGTKSITLDNHIVEIAANISSHKELKTVLNNDAEGIGLFRTEFLYMDRFDFPSEDEQFEVYKTVAKTMGEKPVIVRTFDIGGDKAVNYMGLIKEENPFLGYRAIRISLNQKEIFITQLRAILRASYYGNLKLMFPMICTTEELIHAKEILSQVIEELRSKNISFNENIEVGIMIETPAAAIMSDIMAKEADFLSIGTNDLIQYTMAADRLNTKVSYLYSYYQPSVLRLIQLIIDNGHKEGIKVGICGEAAAESTLIPLWVGMGIDELSMNSGFILNVRKIIQGLKYFQARELSQRILSLSKEEYIRLQLKKESVYYE